MKGRQANLNELADFFGVHRNTVSAWLRDGCPYVQKANRRQGREWIFNTAEVAAWREERAVVNALGDVSNVGEHELKRRKLAAETGTAELEYGVRRGELIEIEKVSDLVAEEYSNLRSKLLTLPVKLAARIGKARTIQQRQTILHDAICDALAELSYDGGDDDPSPAPRTRKRGGAGSGTGKRGGAKPKKKAGRGKKKKAKTAAKTKGK